MIAERRTRRAGGARRAAVAETAAAVLAERGYESTRFADVSEARGAAISTLQNYFGSREDMLIEAIRHATEVEVLALLAEGLRNAQIAQRLVVSQKTVDHHVSAVLRKLNVASRGEAAAEALRLGLLPEAERAHAVGG